MKVKDLCQMTVCLSLLIICSKISFSIGIISITLQTFAVTLIGYLLKWKKASIVFIAYIIMGLIGIPVFSTGGGFEYVLMPSFGFIIGFFLSGFITGSNILKDKKWAKLIKGIAGLLVIDLTGMIYMYFILKFHLNSPNANVIYILQAGFLPFIAKDLISVYLSFLISLRLEVIFNEYGNYDYTGKEIN